MHVLIDALSANNLSGRHVLLGHLREMHAGLGERFRYTVLTHRDNADLAPSLPAGMTHVCAPIGGGWLARTLWMWRHGRALCDARAIDIVFSPAGMLSTGVNRPQVVLAQNPWPLVPGLARGVDRFKSLLQRRSYRRAQHEAALMVFNSRFMQDLYRRHFGAPKRSIVAYQGVDTALFSAACDAAVATVRDPIVLSVSVMARHKAIEVLVAAFAQVAAAVPKARLVLAGAWPDAEYRDEIRAQIADLCVQDQVEVRGHVTYADLLGLYRSARVFCLPSRCESFGIPAIEAQVFGTPALVADGTAAPEVTDAGELAVAQDDVAATARVLQRLLVDDAFWRQASVRARNNAARFHWRDCSAPMLEALDTLASEIAIA